MSLGVCGVDTAYNYRGFTSHRALAASAGNLLTELTVSTKVGFFPGPSDTHPVHSLEPARLRCAVEQSAHDLGRAPDVVLLHNPERTLVGVPATQGHDLLAAACTALAGTVADGLAGA